MRIAQFKLACGLEIKNNPKKRRPRKNVILKQTGKCFPEGIKQY